MVQVNCTMAFEVCGIAPPGLIMYFLGLRPRKYMITLGRYKSHTLQKPWYNYYMSITTNAMKLIKFLPSITNHSLHMSIACGMVCSPHVQLPGTLLFECTTTAHLRTFVFNFHQLQNLWTISTSFGKHTHKVIRKMQTSSCTPNPAFSTSIKR